MRIAILGSRGVPARYGGFEVCAERLGLGLLRSGWRVEIFCPRYQRYRQPTYKGLRLRYAYHGPGVWGSVLYDLLCLLRAALSDNDVILMLGHSTSVCCFLPRVLGKKVVINTDGLEWMRPKWSRSVRAYLRLSERVASWAANALVSDSEHIRAYYLRRYGVRSAFIPYGSALADTATSEERAEPLWERWELDVGSYYIVVARLEPENSIREIIEGFLLAGTKRRLVLVGPGTDYYERRCRSLIDADRVMHVGAIYDRDDLLLLWGQAFAYLHGHTVGGTNPALLDAMALGRFVIARDVPFNREVLMDSGRYFRSAEDLARTLVEVEGLQPEELRQTVERAKNRIAEAYSWEQVIRQYESLFLSLNRRRDRWRRPLVRT